MAQNPFCQDLPGGDRADDPVGGILRRASQVIGLLLILTGAYYALSILAAGISFARDPTELAPALTAMAKTLNLEDAALPVGEGNVPLGRTLSGVAVLLWYLLSAWIAIMLIAAGGKLVLGVIGERREFLAAIREFMLTLRKEDPDQHPRKPT